MFLAYQFNGAFVKSFIKAVGLCPTPRWRRRLQTSLFTDTFLMPATHININIEMGFLRDVSLEQGAGQRPATFALTPNAIA